MKHWGLKGTCTKLWLLTNAIGMILTISPAAIARSTLTQTKDTQAETSSLKQKVHTVLAIGSVGAQVKQVQSMLALMGYYSGPVDGTYGQSTADAVGQFQRETGLNADGVVGPLTWQRLLPSLTTLEETTPVATPTEESEATAPNNNGSTTSTDIGATSAITAGNLPILQIEDSGSSVEQLQARLTELNFYSGPLDGIFGPQTEQAVQNFQRQSGLSVDGVVGPETWQKLL